MNNGPLRILEVVDTLDGGGMEQQLVALINRLDPARFQFEVCCLRHAGVNAVKLAPGIPVHPLLKAEGFQVSTARQMRALLKRGFHVVHTHNLSPLIYAALATLGGRTVPLFHGEHSQFTPAEFSPKRVWQRRLLYLCTRAVHTVSSGQRDELLRAGVKHRRLTAIVNGVDIDRFHPLPDKAARAAARARMGFGSPNEIWVGIVARFGAFKRHADLICAFESVAAANSNLRLLIVGDGGPEKERVLALMRQSPVAARMHWTGYQSDPAPCYQVLDILAVPSSNEGLSNTTLEAMATAVPVLSNDICGARELIAEGEGGWVRDLTTIAQLTAELQKVLALDETEREIVGARGRARVATQFSWSAMGRNYADWLAACAGRSAFPA
ncbi:MAG: glycosyltransferase [Prosthecobacter sp.]|nr:glycosyltransferase [Prosthecobacter sp.]